MFKLIHISSFLDNRSFRQEGLNKVYGPVISPVGQAQQTSACAVGKQNMKNKNIKSFTYLNCIIPTNLPLIV